VKEPLRKVLETALLFFPELTTVLTRIEAVINTRPLTTVRDDIRDPTPITPAHLALGRSLFDLPDLEVVTLVNVVVASCTLHNICELQDNVFLEDWEPYVIPLNQPSTVAIVDAAETTDATDVRDARVQCFALEVPHASRGCAARV